MQLSSLGMTILNSSNRDPHIALSIHPNKTEKRTWQEEAIMLELARVCFSVGKELSR